MCGTEPRPDDRAVAGNPARVLLEHHWRLAQIKNQQISLLCGRRQTLNFTNTCKVFVYGCLDPSRENSQHCPADEDALLDGVFIDDAKVFNNKLREWEDYYNYHRPHGGLNGQTPYERLRQKTQTRP
jgi:transposase InsO family protein